MSDNEKVVTLLDLAAALEQAEPIPEPTYKPWRQSEALAYCIEFEAIARTLDLHIALTGSVLYGGGTGKDLDILIYGHEDKIVRGWDLDAFIEQLRQHFGIEKLYGSDDKGGYGLKNKIVAVTTFKGRRIDFIVPYRK